MYIYVIGILNKLHYIFLLLLSGCLLSGSPRKLLCLLEQKNNYALSQFFSYEGITRRVCWDALLYYYSALNSESLTRFRLVIIST